MASGSKSSMYSSGYYSSPSSSSSSSSSTPIKNTVAKPSTVITYTEGGADDPLVKYQTGQQASIKIAKDIYSGKVVNPYSSAYAIQPDYNIKEKLTASSEASQTPQDNSFLDKTLDAVKGFWDSLRKSGAVGLDIPESIIGLDIPTPQSIAKKLLQPKPADTALIESLSLLEKFKAGDTSTLLNQAAQQAAQQATQQAGIPSPSSFWETAKTPFYVVAGLIGLFLTTKLIK